MNLKNDGHITFSRTLLACTLALSMAACSSTSPAPVPDITPPSGEMLPTDADTTTDIPLGNLALSILSGDNALTGNNWISAINGYGPVELNRSNGEAGANDGRVLNLNGKTYTKGYGVHATSKLSFAIGGKCKSFTADIGVDDEVGSKGSVVFQLFGDGVKLYDSGTMTGASATKSIKVDIAGRSTLLMVVTDAGNGNAYDHADWANPYLLGCESTALPVPPVIQAPAPAPAPAPAVLTYSAPLVITKGGTYTGAWESLDVNVPAVKVMTSEPVVIENCLVRGRGTLISAAWQKANLTVRGCKGVGLNPNDTSRTPGRFLNAEGFQSMLVERNTLEKTSGMYFYQWLGDGTNPTTITVRQNLAKDIEGRYSDGKGGFQSSFYRVQFVQLNGVKNIPRVEIAWNRVDNTPRASHIEDTINLFASNGLPSSPIKVHNNLIVGAYHGTPNASYSGGGIMLGDGGGAYQEASNNVILETSNYGAAVAGGNYMTVKDNLVLGTGKLADGTIVDADPDAGIYIRDYANDPAHIASSVVASGNTVGWGRPRADNVNARWDMAISAAAGVSLNNTRVGPVNLAIDPTLLKNAVVTWEGRVSAQNLAIGTP